MPSKRKDTEFKEQRVRNPEKKNKKLKINCMDNMTATKWKSSFQRGDYLRKFVRNNLCMHIKDKVNTEFRFLKWEVNVTICLKEKDLLGSKA